MLSNIETIIGIIISIIGVPALIWGAIVAIRKMKKLKFGDDDNMGNNIVTQTTNQQQGDVTTNQGANSNSTIFNMNDSATINFPVSLEKKMEANREADPTRRIRLSRVYTSVYAENGKLQKEKIILNEVGDDGKISGTIKLLTSPRKEEYLLSATFFNKVINGVYYANDDSKDECGTINIKQISEDIYSGVCTFSKLGAGGKDAIKSSPYVWVKGENNDLLSGTYSFCEDCPKQTEMCCCASEKVDMPVLLSNETSNLRDKNEFHRRYNIGTFTKKIDNSPIYQMLHKRDKKDDEPDHCFFYDYQKKKCQVYQYRPIDCRLFPFDIRLNNKQRPGQSQAVDNEYWVGYYPGLCCKDLPSKEEMEKYVILLRPYFYLLAPYVEAYTRSDIFAKLENEDFELLYPLRDMIY